MCGVLTLISEIYGTIELIKITTIIIILTLVSELWYYRTDQYHYYYYYSHPRLLQGHKLMRGLSLFIGHWR